MDNELLCIVLYYKEEPQTGYLKRYWDFIEYILSNEQRRITHWEFSLDFNDRGKQHQSLKNGNAKFYNEIILQNEDLHNIDLFSMEKGKNKWVDPVLSIDIKKPVQYTEKYFVNGRLHVQFTLRETRDEYLSAIIAKAMNVIKIEYGLITMMENMKLPYFYFGNIGTEELTEEDRIEMKTWERNMKNADILIRNLYYGNIVTSKHFNHDRERLYLIKAELEKDGVFTNMIDEDTLFFIDKRFLDKESPFMNGIKVMFEMYSAKFMK